MYNAMQIITEICYEQSIFYKRVKSFYFFYYCLFMFTTSVLGL